MPDLLPTSEPLVSAIPTREEALHEAVGWLVNAIETLHPGFVAKQARRAHETPAIAAVMEDWAARLHPSEFSVTYTAQRAKQDAVPVLIEALSATSHLDYAPQRAAALIDALVEGGVQLIVTTDP